MTTGVRYKNSYWEKGALVAIQKRVLLQLSHNVHTTPHTTRQVMITQKGVQLLSKLEQNAVLACGKNKTNTMTAQ